MTAGDTRPAALPQSLGRLRLRLTAWYVGTFFAILALLGIAMFAAITARFDRELDASLRTRRTSLRASRGRVWATRRSRSAILDTANDLRIPDRTLYLSSTPPDAPWMGAPSTPGSAAWRSTRRARAQRRFAFDTPMGLRACACGAFSHGDGTDAGRDRRGRARSSSRIATRPHRGVRRARRSRPLVLVAVGGWLLARKSTAPVERAMVHMRRFMADAAHELRTPLAVVRSRAEVALQRSRDARGVSRRR